MDGTNEAFAALIVLTWLWHRVDNVPTLGLITQHKLINTMMT